MPSSSESCPRIFSRLSPNHRTNASFASMNFLSLNRKIVMFTGLARKALLKRSSLSRSRCSECARLDSSSARETIEASAETKSISSADQSRGGPVCS